MIPSVGLGTWKSVPAQVRDNLYHMNVNIGFIERGQQITWRVWSWREVPGKTLVKQAVLAALDNGYRHIDCAAAYSNEESVGVALRERVGPGKSLKREELFLTSKLWNTEHHPDDVEAACRRSLTHLGVSYLDLHLMHWPMAFERGSVMMPSNAECSVRYADTHYIDTWKAMETLVDQGLVKGIGLSNFNARQTDLILSIARHKPVVNQVECHPFLAQQQLLTHCRDRGVAVAAYSPLGSPDRPWPHPGEPALMGDPRIMEIARRCGKTAAQVIIRWHVQRGIICIRKSVTPSRIQQNLQVFDFQLTDEDMKLIESFNRNERLIIPTVEDKCCPLKTIDLKNWKQMVCGFRSFYRKDDEKYIEMDCILTFPSTTPTETPSTPVKPRYGYKADALTSA